jgi:GT2 family glycosyltransferase
MATRALVVINPKGPEQCAEGLDQRWERVDMPNNRGYAAAVNEGFRRLADDAARGTIDHVLLLTHDVSIELGDVQALRQRLADERVGVVGPVLIEDHHGVATAGGWYTRLGRARRQVVDGDRRTGVVDKVDWIDGACMLVRASCVSGTAFDEGTFLYVEDVAFCLEMADAGRGVVIEPWATAHQRSGAVSRPGAHGYLIVRNQIRLARRRRGVRGVLESSCAGVAFALREGCRAIVFGSERRFHARQTLGALWGVGAGLRGRDGVPPARLLGSGDIVIGRAPAAGR